MGRMQCLQSAVSPPAHWSISSTRLHARPKADAVKLKVSMPDIDGTSNVLLHPQTCQYSTAAETAHHLLQVACLRMQSLSIF